MRKSSSLAVVFSLISAFSLLMSSFASASGGGGVNLIDPEIDLKDEKSLQRGAELFIDYCLSCHSASFMRYNRMASDIGLTDEQVKKDMMFTTDKVGDVMKVAMSPEDAAAWFGTQPPDLSVVSRSRGLDWLYSYLLGFYEDPNPSRPFGVNNIVFPEVGMPHVLLGLQGIQKKHESHGTDEHHHGHGAQGSDQLELVQDSGSMTADEYRKAAKDLVTFLAYMGEPAKVQRQELGIWVLAFLAVFFIATYLLKKEYWKDIH
uniref:Ubiquinol-cytochrome c reductase cytochrome c1 subunit n=1 Tax=Candidatus Kentrum sp. FM TaxID=2126340 RepID=A0A450STA8_9GAMM|nr:MAG: ubiquinol-cytochrome c reductase cytochrome c1 subunit [Candidatus Kentron sp. FM]VFJ57398.1 MAG: ubiquinol-cytochrome c reductase cytochrome c1 subunit [Candidatus Kentron sp. FM]VFK08502.1 MAG: ubiquinol-cytochrome c reductase cytochrome c1 subunit [Candidatus Kentron sp. FM]